MRRLGPAALAALLRTAMPALLAMLACAPAPLPAAEPLLDFSAHERARIAAHGPWPPPALADLSNRWQGRPQAEVLGRALFHDKRLSSDGRQSCASCHVPALAFQDSRALPAGRLPHAAAGRRNTPSLLDTAWQRWLGWDGAHDSLWAASLAPLMASAEMGHDSAAGVAAAVRDTPGLRSAWQRALGPLSADDETLAVDLAKVLAAYQATLVSPRTAFDAFRDALQRGDTRSASRYPLPAQRGLRLFVGKAGCSTCHAGPAFSNGEFADIGRPFFVPGGVDSGRHGGLARLQGSRFNRLGLFNDAAALRGLADAGDVASADPRAVTTRHAVQDHRHFGEFRVPTLRGLLRTAPYMHDGSLPTLASVVQHYSLLDEERLHADGERILRRLDLSAADAADLEAFLRSLSSR